MGEGPLRNMYKGHMDKAEGGRFEGGRWGWEGWGSMEVCKWRQLYLNNKKRIFRALFDLALPLFSSHIHHHILPKHLAFSPILKYGMHFYTATTFVCEVTVVLYALPLCVHVACPPLLIPKAFKCYVM